MKKRKTILFLFLLSVVLMSTSLLAQITEEKAKATIEEFFLLCKNNDFKNSSKILAYYGENNSRIYKDIFNSNNPDEFK